MAADIHTKSFKDSVSWTHACQLINIFPPEQIGSQDIMDLMRPTHPKVWMRRANSFTRSRVRCPVFPTLRLPYCRRCCIARVYRVKKVCRSTTVLTPSWLSSSRACCGIRRPRCRRGVICAQPGFFAKACGINWKIMLSFRTRRLSSIATWNVPFFSFIRCGPLWWRPRWSRTQSRLLYSALSVWTQICARPAA